MNRILGLTVAGALAAIAGCSTAPIQNSRLETAEQAVRSASMNPEVTARAPLELDKARKALDVAESSWQQGADAAVINHQAYLAEQRARIAIESAAQRKAEAELAQADAERNAVLLQARERQAREAQAKADARLHQAEQAKSQAQQAEEAARRAQQLAAEHERAAAQRQAQLEQERQRADALASQVSNLQSQMQDMKAQQTDRGWVLTLGADVLFDTGQSTLKPGSRQTLRRLASFLAEHPGQAVEVDGYADSIGSEAANEDLSRRRAEAVKDALAGLGIDASRITVRGLGESYPVASNDTAAGRQLNRRVEIVLPRNESTARAESRASQGSSSPSH